jgi:hypothetical protein
MKNTNFYQKVVSIYFVGMVLLWAAVLVQGSKTANINYWYSFLFGLIPLAAGFVGMVKSKVWGRFRSALGRAVFFVSLGLFCWGFGESIWAYYNFFRHVPAPYPSIADIGFAPSIFFWLVGTIYLAKASGAWLALRRSRRAQLFTAAAVVGISALSYFLLIHVARGGVLVPQDESTLKTVLDIAYPLGDFLAANLAFIVLVLSFKYLGGVYRPAIAAVLAGLFAMFVGDVIFSYATTVGTYYNGDWGDLLLCVGLFLLSFGVLGFAAKPSLTVVDEQHNEI